MENKLNEKEEPLLPPKEKEFENMNKTMQELFAKKNNDEYHLVMYEYSRLSAKLKRRGYLKKENPLPMDVKAAYDLYLADYNARHKKQKDIDTDALFEHYEKVMYS